MYWQSKEQENTGSSNSPVDQMSDPSWEEISFLHSFPEAADDKGVAVLLDGSMRSYIQCKGINALLFDKDDRQRLAQNFTELAETCACDMQIIVKARNLPVDEYLSRYQILIKTENDYLNWYGDYTDKWFRRVQDVHFVPQRDFYVVLSYQPPHCATASGEPWNGKRSKKNQADYLNNLHRLTETAVQKLRASDLRPHVLSRTQVRNLIYADLNPCLKDWEATAPACRGGSEAASLACSALRIEDEHLWLDGRYVATQYLQEMPDQSFMGWLVDLLTLSYEYSLSLFIHRCEQGKARLTLRQNYRSGVIKNTRLETPEDHHLETIEAAAQSVEQSSPSSSLSQDFDISLYITTNAESPITLAKNVIEIRRVFMSRGAVLNRAQMLQLNAWQSTLASAVDRLAVVHRVPAATVGDFWPFFSASCGTPDGAPYGFAIASREPVLLNPFFRSTGKDTDNMLILGSSASFARSMLILRLLPFGTRFVLLNPSDMASFIPSILGPELSSCIEFGPDSGCKLNPFDLDSADQGEPSPDKLSYLLGLMDLILAPDDQELSLEEKSLLDGLIRLAYKEARAKGSCPCLLDLARLLKRALKRETDLEPRKQLEKLYSALWEFTKKGASGAPFVGLTNIDAEKLLLVIDTSKLVQPRLKGIAQSVLAEFIKRRAVSYKERNVRFAAIIDDASDWMREKPSARLLADLCQHSRKVRMMVVSVSRHFKDFCRHPEQARLVVKHSPMKLILRQYESDLKALQETFRLTDAETASLEQFGRDSDATDKMSDYQCLFMVGSHHGTIRLVPSPMDYWVCTTQRSKDQLRRDEMKREIKEKNPKLSDTDACRQAVYHLGINDGD